MEKFTYKTDVKELKKVLIEHDIQKISQLSKLCGVSKNILGNVLNKGIQPNADTMLKLVNALNINPQQAGQIFFSIELSNEEDTEVDIKVSK